MSDGNKFLEITEDIDKFPLTSCFFCDKNRTYRTIALKPDLERLNGRCVTHYHICDDCLQRLKKEFENLDI